MSRPPSRSASRTRPLTTDGAFGRFADGLLALELPDLPVPARTDTVVFVCRRARALPTPLRLGLTALSVLVGAVARVVGSERTTPFLAHTALPFVGELARLVRSLGVAYVWETWPSTSPTGAPAAPVPA